MSEQALSNARWQPLPKQHLKNNAFSTTMFTLTRSQSPTNPLHLPRLLQWIRYSGNFICPSFVSKKSIYSRGLINIFQTSHSNSDFNPYRVAATLDNESQVLNSCQSVPGSTPQSDIIPDTDDELDNVIDGQIIPDSDPGSEPEPLSLLAPSAVESPETSMSQLPDVPLPQTANSNCYSAEEVRQLKLKLIKKFKCHDDAGLHKKSFVLWSHEDSAHCATRSYKNLRKKVKKLTQADAFDDFVSLGFPDSKLKWAKFKYLYKKMSM